MVSVDGVFNDGDAAVGAGAIAAPDALALVGDAGVRTVARIVNDKPWLQSDAKLAPFDWTEETRLLCLCHCYARNLHADTTTGALIAESMYMEIEPGKPPGAWWGEAVNPPSAHVFSSFLEALRQFDRTWISSPMIPLPPAALCDSVFGRSAGADWRKNIGKSDAPTARRAEKQNRPILTASSFDRVSVVEKKKQARLGGNNNGTLDK